jgi:3'(2'), 5'-bisphosphate nucleotidase
MTTPTIQDYQTWLPHVCDAARQAGERILEIYQCLDCEVEKKSDGSPVTQADKQADLMIQQALTALTPDIPVVSEESLEHSPFSMREQWRVFWLVDPLDGTKEFIERTDEFCVNIALIVDGEPVLGVIYGPVADRMYSAYKGGQATRVQGTKCQQLRVNHQPGRPVKVTVSRRHGRRVDDFLKQLGGHELVLMGSALKACLIAEGQADVYPRFGPTSHWDTAASQVIVEAAGGALVDAQLQPLRYWPTDDLLNPGFMVVGNLNFSWPKFPTPQ